MVTRLCSEEIHSLEGRHITKYVFPRTRYACMHVLCPRKSQPLLPQILVAVLIPSQLNETRVVCMRSLLVLIVPGRDKPHLAASR